MRISKTFLPILLMFSFLLNLEAQDRHFTLFDFAPLVINPAYTGAYEGTVRVGGLFRDQGNPFVDNVYKTGDFYVDAPLLNVRKRDWIGVGLNIYRDRAGTFSLGYQTIHASLAYHLSLDSRNNNVLTLGIQGGTVMRDIRGVTRAVANQGTSAFDRDVVVTVDPNTRIDPFNGFDSEDLPMANFFDLNAGMLLKSKLNKATNIEVGFSLQHITRNFVLGDTTDQSNYVFTDLNPNDDFRIPTLFVLHGKYNVDLTEVFSLSPRFLFQQTGNQNEAVIQAWAGYKLLKRELRDDGRKGRLIKDDEAPKVEFGLGYRLGDALQVLLGFRKGDFRAGIGYDLTLSTLADANGGNGALEFAASYIFRIYKQPEVDPAILCPKF